MRVAFDEQIFVLQRQGGISRAFLELIPALNRIPDVTALPPRGPVTHPRAAREWDLSLARGRVARRALTMMRQMRPAATPPCDLQHATFYDAAWLRNRSRAPLVVTVYDMIPELFPESVPRDVHRAKREFVARADLILTISECTRSDLIDCYGQPAAPVVTTPLGVDPGFFLSPPGGGERILPRDYLLYVGERGGYKDFDVVLQALTDLPAMLLLAVGGGDWRPAEVRRIRDLGMSDRVHWRVLSDRDLALAYAGATAFVMPSRHEGFGLPLLEALAAGAPVVAARAGSLPEVGGDIPWFFEPGDPAALTRSILAAQSADPARLEEGRRRAREYTWDRTARLTAEAYRSVLA